MREIKFRVWDKIHKKMYEWGQFRVKVNRGGGCQMMLSFNAAPKESYEIMQYTGLEDATKWEDLTEEEREGWVKKGNLPLDWNGKEIYEGDIIKHKMHWLPEPKDIIEKIEWNENLAGFDPFCTYDGDCGIFVDIDTVEIIGNIYENPDLLEGK